MTLWGFVPPPPAFAIYGKDRPAGKALEAPESNRGGSATLPHHPPGQ